MPLTNLHGPAVVLKREGRSVAPTVGEVTSKHWDALSGGRQKMCFVGISVCAVWKMVDTVFFEGESVIDSSPGPTGFNIFESAAASEVKDQVVGTALRAYESYVGGQMGKVSLRLVMPVNPFYAELAERVL